jgi:Raf kinase inhibitor-like YbhB/YbcL family protein
MRAWIGLVLAPLVGGGCSRSDRPQTASAGNTVGATASASTGSAYAVGDTARPSGGRGMRPATPLALTSAAFRSGDSIPTRFTCDGANHSPPLAWSGAPEKTVAYALVVEDPDAPGGTFVHWVLYDLPARTTSLPEGVPKGDTVAQVGGAQQGATGFKGTPGYGGPCPPPGPAHHYHFRLLALDAKLGLAPGASRDDVMNAAKGHELALGEIVATYARKR